MPADIPGQSNEQLNTSVVTSFAWSGMEGAKGYDSPGALRATNVRFWIEGECQRRHGMIGFASGTGGTQCTGFKCSATGGFAVFFNAGSLIAVPA
jgi:hypothetical protein